jgi:hypothetical protein
MNNHFLEELKKNFIRMKTIKLVVFYNGHAFRALQRVEELHKDLEEMFYSRFILLQTNPKLISK